MITKTGFPVRFTEIDGLGIVHHSIYPVWFEAGRSDFFKKAGIPGSSLKAQGLCLPLTEMKCAYKSPARFGNEILVITRLISISCVKAKFEYRILSKADGKLLAAGTTMHAWTDKNIKPINIEREAPDVYNRLLQLVEPEESTHAMNSI